MSALQCFPWLAETKVSRAGNDPDKKPQTYHSVNILFGPKSPLQFVMTVSGSDE